MAQYICIDLKSFYASVECVDRGLDPLTTNLVVADLSRTEKTICLAVTPPLKAYGIGGRARLFEVISAVKGINADRRRAAPGRIFTGKSTDAPTLAADPALALDYIVAPPRMGHYVQVSTSIYAIYLRYVAPEDIHVYSIDEVFLDVTPYLGVAKMTAREFAAMLIREVLAETGITAAAGIGENLYLAKVAMDIVAKHVPANEEGVRIAELDTAAYRRLLWGHRPLTDFWRVGRGMARRLEKVGLYTMGDIARCSLTDEDLLFRLFGINAELLIDHAWGHEPCTIADIKAYRPASNSLCSGQVLTCPYPAEKARLVAREMADLLSLDLVAKRLVTDQLVLDIGYDRENVTPTFTGQTVTDHYGRALPKPAHGSLNLARHTSSSRRITTAVAELFDRIADPSLTVRRLTLTANRVIDERHIPPRAAEQLDLFTDYTALEAAREAEADALARERRMQEAVLTLKRKYGKNIVLRGMNLEEDATARERNAQIGGHKA